jgi:phospholipid-translocating ATPase
MNGTSIFVQNLKLRPGAPMPLLVNPQLQEELYHLNLQRVPEQSSISDMRHITHAQRIQEFLLLLAVCNTVVVSRHPHHDMVNDSLIIFAPV